MRVLIVWYNLQLTKADVCIRLPIVRIHKVAHVQDAVLQIYDYYEPSEYKNAKSLFFDSQA